MTNQEAQEVLEKAIYKAIDGGWLSSKKFKSFRKYSVDFDVYGEECSWCEVQQFYSMGPLYPQVDFRWYADEELIYNHDFAKALWGEDKELFSIGDCTVFHETAWKEHLRRMVIADDPIKYLGENI